MPAPYSNDLRQKVIEAYKNREDWAPGLARRFKVSVDFVRDLIKRHEETGDILPKPHNGGFPPEYDVRYPGIFRARPVWRARHGDRKTGQ